MNSNEFICAVKQKWCDECIEQRWEKECAEDEMRCLEDLVAATSCSGPCCTAGLITAKRNNRKMISFIVKLSQ